MSVCPSRETQRDQDGGREGGRQRERHWGECLLLTITQHHPEDPLHQTDSVLGTRKLPKGHISRLRFNPVFVSSFWVISGCIVITPRSPLPTEMFTVTFFRFPPRVVEPPGRGDTGKTPASSRPDVHPVTSGHLLSNLESGPRDDDEECWKHRCPQASLGKALHLRDPSPVQASPSSPRVRGSTGLAAAEFHTRASTRIHEDRKCLDFVCFI